MKNRMSIVLVGVLFLSFLFYWLQLRPTQVRKECIKNYPYAFGDTTSGYQPGEYIGMGKVKADKAGYEKCLRENGLEK